MMCNTERLAQPYQWSHKAVRSVAAIGLAASGVLPTPHLVRPLCAPRHSEPSQTATYLPEISGFDAMRMTPDVFQETVGVLGIRIVYRPKSGFNALKDKPTVAQLKASPNVRKAVLEGLSPYSREFLGKIGVKVIEVTAIDGVAQGGQQYAGYYNFRGTIGLDYRHAGPLTVRHEVGHAFDEQSCGSRLKTEHDPVFEATNPDGVMFYRRPGARGVEPYEPGYMMPAKRRRLHPRAPSVPLIHQPSVQPGANVAEWYAKNRVDEDKASVFAVATSPGLVVCVSDTSTFTRKVSESRRRIAMLDRTQAEHIDAITHNC
jgi:hypothetical protein